LVFPSFVFLQFHELMLDPFLSSYSAIILDEVPEPCTPPLLILCQYLGGGNKYLPIYLPSKYQSTYPLSTNLLTLYLTFPPLLILCHDDGQGARTRVKHRHSLRPSPSRPLSSA
jgi:hypothetical protein